MARAGRGFLLKPLRPLYRRTFTSGLRITTGLAPIGVGSSSSASTVGVTTTTGLAPIGVSSSSSSVLFSTTTTGLAPIGVSSSSESRTLVSTTGLAPVGVGSSSLSYAIALLVAYTGEDHDIQVNVEFSGAVELELPESVIPVDFDGLLDPLIAPTLEKSDTAGGHLPDGTYQYAYAAWKGSEGQATAPSPWSESIILTTEDTVTLTYETVEGADGYLVYRMEV